jgi:two-component system, cell cycle sensor histidine kinase and response regulator CckA
MNEKVLIVDDEQDILETLSKILTAEGYLVEKALNGEDALTLFQTRSFEAVITDVRMPGIDGIELTRALKKIDEYTEVIILTGYATMETAISALRKDGAFDYLMKPIEDIDILYKTLGNAIEHRSLKLRNKWLMEELWKRNLVLKESEKKYRQLIEDASDGICTVDGDGNFFDTNPKMSEIFGYTKDEWLKMNVLEIVDAEELREKPIRFDLLSKGETVVSQRRAHHKNGHDVYVEVSAKMAQKGKFQAIVRDVTPRKQAEEEKRKIETRLRQAERMASIAKLAGGVAHQFNNALSVITGNLELLRCTYTRARALKETLNDMEESAFHMAKLTQQLLAYARGGRYVSKIIMIKDFIAVTVPLVEHTLRADVQMVLDIPEALPPVEVDLPQMQMVMSALVDNASEAIEGAGRIMVRCRNVYFTEDMLDENEGFKPGAYIWLAVIDDGRGMDDESRQRIFEPFYSTKFQGRGLGMAAAYGIVKNHDGWISVDSEPGKGTSVAIYLPAIEDHVENAEPVVEEPVKGSGTVLIVEDEVVVLKMFRNMLNRLGYRVLEAKTGKEAAQIAKVQSKAIDAVLLDVVLPDMEGIEVYTQLSKVIPGTKVLVCSGFSDNGPARQILDAGAHGFLQKPFSSQELSVKVNEIIRR